MSDDGRTTGVLMNLYNTTFGTHLPPPGDLRRCLFSLSFSRYKNDFSKYMEYEITDDVFINDLTISDLFALVKPENLDFLSFIQTNIKKEILDFKLSIRASAKGHKMGNLLMANIFHNFGDYNKMIDFMHDLLEVRGTIVPVTTCKAYIKAKLIDGTIIEKQDNISNVANYNSPIQNLELMSCSTDAKQEEKVKEAIKNADFIVVGPGDIYTSVVANLIIGDIRYDLRNSHAKLIYISNNTNKGGETNGLRVLDFINVIERYLSKKLDYVIVNNYLPKLSNEEQEKLSKNISVKGGDYVFLDEFDKYLLLSKNTKIIEDDFIDKISLYKHNNIKIAETLLDIMKTNPVISTETK
ncbi:MAG: 2-phospho-L-lactate transferase CofD family protein [Candidatus Gracilibacteria bacterium]|nr:2-phospho-L-lactate transferase CofD family protein [Candidatus Gracilibacteria bacterium]